MSFVIPAYNEAKNIGRCIQSITANVPGDLPHEVIVVDHRSKDETALIACAAGARVIRSNASTIAGVRNDGVSESTGEFLVFLDADCALSPEWGARVGSVLQSLSSSPADCAGSQVSPPAGCRSVLSKHWFVPFTERATHLGSAHFICSRETFLSLGGFDERLETGEDYDLGQRFVRAGGQVRIEPKMRVFHYDFPSNIREFIRRERWHGRGDAVSVGAVLRSKVALASLAFVGLILLGIVVAATGQPIAGALLLGGSIALVVASSFARLRGVSVTTRLYSFGLLALYYWARFLSVVDSVTRSRAIRNE